MAPLTWRFAAVMAAAGVFFQALCFAAPPAPAVTIRSGLEGEVRITTPAAGLETVRDLAYDPDARRFYLLRSSTAGQEVESAGPAAKENTVWKLGNDLVPASILYVRKGLVRCVAREKAADRMVELTFNRATTPEVGRELLPASAPEFDRLLSPARFERIRTLMSKLGLIPTPRSFPTRSGNALVFGDAAPHRLIDSFFVNARDLYGDRISSTDDLRVFVLAREWGAVDLVMKTADGEYQKQDLGELVRGAVLRTYHSSSGVEAPSVRVLSAQVVPNGVMLGMESVRSGFTRYHILRVDLSNGSPKVSVAEKSCLARVLERF